MQLPLKSLSKESAQIFILISLDKKTFNHFKTLFVAFTCKLGKKLFILYLKSYSIIKELPKP